MSNENFTNKVLFIVNDGYRIKERNFWAFDSTEIGGIQYRHANEFTIVKGHIVEKDNVKKDVKYICFIPYNIDQNASVKAMSTIAWVNGNLASNIMIKYHDVETKMQEGFTYKFNENRNEFDVIPVPDGISFKTYNKNTARIAFKNDTGKEEFFNEPMFSTFADGDKFVLNKFYWAFDEESKLAIFQEFILRTRSDEHRRILLKKYVSNGDNKELTIRCSIGQTEFKINPSSVINAYPKGNNNYGIAFSLIGLQQDDQRISEYDITELGLEIFDVTNN